MKVAVVPKLGGTDKLAMTVGAGESEVLSLVASVVERAGKVWGGGTRAQVWLAIPLGNGVGEVDVDGVRDLIARFPDAKLVAPVTEPKRREGKGSGAANGNAPAASPGDALDLTLDYDDEGVVVYEPNEEHDADGYFGDEMASGSATSSSSVDHAPNPTFSEPPQQPSRSRSKSPGAASSTSSSPSRRARPASHVQHLGNSPTSFTTQTASFAAQPAYEWHQPVPESKPPSGDGLALVFLLLFVVMVVYFSTRR